MLVKHYEIHCATEGVWKDWYLDASEAEPTTCPTDSAHTVIADSANYQETIGAAEVSLKNEDGTTANFPQTAGKTPIFQPNVVPAGYYFYGTGAFDDIAAVSRGDGAQIVLEVTGADASITVEGRFLEHVYIIGGFTASVNAGFEDHISLLLKAPASAPTSTPGVGNANKVATGAGFNIIVPATNGDWTVDGSTMEAGEINQSLCPVPNSSGTGYWNWDPTQSPSITPATNGAFDLFDAELPLVRQANRYPLIFDGPVTPEGAVKGKKVLPHWVWSFTSYRKEIGTVKTAVRLNTARISTL